jgi:glycosyltransferase involved in cell wall biosynthesis
MGQARRLGLYSPYFGSVWGGGEKYLACTAHALHAARPELELELAGPVPVEAEEVRAVLGVDLAGVALRSTIGRVTRLHRGLNKIAALRPLRDRVLGGQASRLGAGYDVFVPMVYSIAVEPRGRRNAMLCQFPYRDPGPEIAGFELIVCQSEYVRSWVREYWQRDAAIVNPPIDVPPGPPAWGEKGRSILAVGRFFSGGHSKRQDVLVEAFRKLVDGGLAGWELHLAGSVHRDAHHRGFFEGVARRAEGYPIRLHPDIPRAELDRLYAAASIYWHAAGYGADAEAEPERLEHFGMTTAEAMAHGCVPVVYGAGGQLEVVRDSVDGRLWTTTEQLADLTLQLAGDEGARRRLGEAARAAADRWSRPAFEAAIVDALAPVLPCAS